MQEPQPEAGPHRGGSGYPTSNRIIRASEVGRYVFCARAWWLGSVEGLPSTHLQQMAAGLSAHRRHGCWVRVGLGLARLAYLLLALAVLTAVVALLHR